MSQTNEKNSKKNNNNNIVSESPEGDLFNNITNEQLIDMPKNQLKATKNDSAEVKKKKSKLRKRQKKLTKKKGKTLLSMFKSNAKNNEVKTIKRSKRCNRPDYAKDDSLECFLMNLDDMLLEGYQIVQPTITLKPSEMITKSAKPIDKTFIINVDMEDKSLRSLEEKITKIIVRCKDFNPVIDFIRCFIMKETKGKVLLDEIKELELETPKSGDVTKLLSKKHPTGYDIFVDEDLVVIQAYAKIHAIINYLMNVLRMIYQYQKGMGYFAKLDDKYFKKYNNKKIKTNCDSILQCPSSGPVKQMGYLMGLTERAIIYDLFLPDSSFINMDTVDGLLTPEHASNNNNTQSNNNNQADEEEV